MQSATRVACISLLGPPAAETLHSLAEACLRWTPQVALGERAIFLEIGGCQKLYSEKTFLLRLQALLKRFSISAQVCVAGDIPTALALAVFSTKPSAKSSVQSSGARRPMVKEDLPIEALQIYASPFHSSNSLEKVISLMRSLGVSTLEDALALPRKALAARFGKEAVLALRYVDFAQSLPWPRFVPKEKIIEACEVDDSYMVRELEPVLFLLRGLTDRILLRLRGQGRLVTAFEVRVFQENYSTIKEPLRTYRLELAFPVGSVLSLLSMLRDRLGFTLQREPLESPVVRLEVEVLDSVTSQGRQTDLFSKKEEETESLQAVFARLTERLGEGRAFMAKAVESYVPERSWQKTYSESERLQIRLPLRPLRILKKPQEIQRIDNCFVHRSKKWRVTELVGPERIAGEWWMNDQERDYYRVKTESGDELWVYSVMGSASVGAPQYYLHGVFD